MVSPDVSLDFIKFIDILCRETKRRDEIESLIARGEVPHDVELANRPERSFEGARCKNSRILSQLQLIMLSGLMGKVAGSINDIKTAKEM